MLRIRITAALALVPLAVVACAPGAAEQVQSTATAQAAAPTSSASARPSASASLSATDPETSRSPSARAAVNRDVKVIYLTFDDGPWVPYTQQILDVLAKHDATATFFVVGQMVAEHPDLAKKVTAAGHAIGNHTWDHSDLTTLSDDQIRWQLDKTADAVGPAMAACMRPPYGSQNERTRAVIKKAGYRSYLWDYWAEDWNQPPIPKFLDYLETATEDRSNILLHDGGGDRPNTVEALRIMMPRWIKRGYTFQALPGCLTPHEG